MIGRYLGVVGSTPRVLHPSSIDTTDALRVWQYDEVQREKDPLH